MSVVDEEKSQRALLHNLATPTAPAITQEFNLLSSQELPFMELATIRAATNDFSESNKLGHGGFGTVYKVTPVLFLLFKFSFRDPHDFLMCEISNGVVSGCSAKWKRDSS